MANLAAQPPLVPNEPASALPNKLPSRWTKDNEQYPYEFYKVSIVYLYDPGTKSVPVAVDAATATQDSIEVVRLHAPISRKVVRFHARRQGKKPDLPDATPNSNEVLEDLRIEVGTPAPDDAATVLTFEVRGEYHYTLYKPLGFTGVNYHVPIMPPDCINCVQYEFNIPASSFLQTLK